MSVRTMPFAFALALSVAPAAPALAQQAGTHHAEGNHFGLGAGFTMGSVTLLGSSVLWTGPFGSGSIVMPIDIAGVFRLEPEFGFIHYSESHDVMGMSETDSATAVRPALGAFAMFPLGSSASAYVGARFGPQFVSSSNENVDPINNTTVTTDMSRIDFAVGPAFGGEYFFSKHFSLAVETKIDFTFIGDASTDVTPGPSPADTDDSGLIASTGTMLLARAFFF